MKKPDTPCMVCGQSPCTEPTLLKNIEVLLSAAKENNLITSWLIHQITNDFFIIVEFQYLNIENESVLISSIMEKGFSLTAARTFDTFKSEQATRLYFEKWAEKL